MFKDNILNICCLSKLKFSLFSNNQLGFSENFLCKLKIFLTVGSKDLFKTVVKMTLPLKKTSDDIIILSRSSKTANRYHQQKAF
jgi:hypothetical protein